MLTDPNAVRQWLKALGALTAGAMSQDEADTKVSAYAPLLAKEFAPECFCAASLSAVGAECKFFPSYAEVNAHLSRWWWKHREMTAVRAAPVARERLAAPSAPQPTGEVAKAAVASVVGAFVQERSWNGIGTPNAPPPVKSAPVSDGALLAQYERLAAEGNRAAAVRVEMLRKRIEVVA